MIKTKKILTILAATTLIIFASTGCKPHADTPANNDNPNQGTPADDDSGNKTPTSGISAITIDTQKDKASYGETYTLKIKVAAPTAEDPKATEKIEITAENASTYGVTITDEVITLEPADEKTEFYFTGYFKGQIINKKKKTILNLDDAYLENSDAVISAKKGMDLEISAKGTNYIVTTAEDKNAIDAKDLKLGGSGTCYIVGTKHGIKGNDVEFKGSGTYYVQGAAQIGDDTETGGSAINCDNFIIEKDKTVSLYAINSKNGIKADLTISIAVGTISLLNNTTGIKTDVEDVPAEDATDEEKTAYEEAKATHSIKLSGGTIYDCKNKTFYITEEGNYSAEGATINKVDELPANE